MAADRQIQLAYSDLQPLMLDAVSRTAKGRKITAVVRHFLGRERLEGLSVVDVGCSGGFTIDAFRELGATTLGIDIDEPGLRSARAAFPLPAFAQADSQALPLRDDSVDVMVCNHVYEHVVDAEALASELHRVLRPSGIAYLGLGNRLGVMEPHHRLPFLSWLPPAIAHRYLRLAGRGDFYHERFRTRGGLRDLFGRFRIWDYTMAVLAEPSAFHATDVIPGMVARAPRLALQAAMPIIPTFLWVVTKSDRSPAGAALRIAPTQIAR